MTLYTEKTHRETSGFGIYITKLSYVMLIPIFVLCAYASIKRIHHKFLDCLTLICVSATFTYFTMRALKFFFSRYQVLSIKSHQLLLIKGYYGFQWLKSSGAYSSFPSGHMAMLCTLLMSLWLYYPKLWSLYGLLIVILASIMLYLNLHFVSDLFAGCFLGATISILLHRCMNRR